MEEKKRGRPKKQKIEEEAEQPKKSRKKTGIGKSGNLIPTSVMTDEEKSEFGRKGAYASAIARRKKKELRAFTKDFLMQDAANVLKQNMKMLGVEDDDMTNLAAVVIRLFSKAVNQGDLNAARTLIEWAGMAPLQQEKENGAIAKMAQVMQLAGTGEQENTDNGNVDVLSSDWNDEYFKQLEFFPDGKHDDMVDASSDAFNELAAPKFNLSNLTR